MRHVSPKTMVRDTWQIGDLKMHVFLSDCFTNENMIDEILHALFDSRCQSLHYLGPFIVV